MRWSYLVVGSLKQLIRRESEPRSPIADGDRSVGDGRLDPLPGQLSLQNDIPMERSEGIAGVLVDTPSM